MNYQNINNLVQIVLRQQDEIDYTCIETNPVNLQVVNFPQMLVGSTVVKAQQSTIRTNCMDCLDRTNVVQSVFCARSIDCAITQSRIPASD